MRVRGFVDGFNLYHAICDIAKRDAARKPRVHSAHLKWLNLRALLERLILPGESLGEVRYFSAYAKHLIHGPYDRHQLYTRALEVHGVTPVMGRFKPKDLRCKATCRERYKAHEEKETDVNIALHMVTGAMRGEFDVALLLSADSDQCPAVTMARVEAPSLTIRIVSPPGPGRYPSQDLIAASGGRVHHQLSESDLAACRLPENLVDSEGAFSCPADYRLPP